MPTPETVKAKINNLIALANEKTGESDADLTTAVNRLAEGYGAGGDQSGNTCYVGTAEPASELGNDGDIYIKKG